MLVAYTHTDPDTNVLKGYALEFIEAAGKLVTQVLKPRTGSSAANICAALTADPDAPLFFFGHGFNNPYCLVGQDGRVALDQKSGHLLANRLVCATCCYGINTLHPAALNNGATVLGYDGPLQVPRYAPYVFDLEDCILDGLKELLAGRTAGDAEAVTRQRLTADGNRLLGGSINDMVFAQTVFQPNAAAVRLVGNPARTI
ncbi:MAG TPA: hypothetical protein VGF55_24785 [Gemmataceae bacterium]|jgi:hypothetical protein